MELGEKRGLRKGYTMRKSKTVKIILDTYGNYLGMGRGCLVLKNEKGVEEGRYPLAEMELGSIVQNLRYQRHNQQALKLARMLVSKFVCEVSRSSGFVWLVGGDGDLSRKECCKTRYSALSHSKREIWEHTCAPARKTMNTANALSFKIPKRRNFNYSP